VTSHLHSTGSKRINISRSAIKESGGGDLLDPKGFTVPLSCPLSLSTTWILYFIMRVSLNNVSNAVLSMMIKEARRRDGKKKEEEEKEREKRERKKRLVTRPSTPYTY